MATKLRIAQDEARAQAQQLCDEGDKLLAGFDGRIRWKDSIDKAIAEYKKGLELKDQVNGDRGWASCMQSLVEKLANAEQEKAEQDAAQVHVSTLLDEAAVLLSPQTEPSNIGVDDIARMVSGIVAAQQMPTNDSDLVKRLKETLSAAQTIKDAEAAARAEARTKYAAGERLMAKSDKESETIDDAIATYKTALDQNTHDHAQKTKISEALEVAVQAKVAQDEARAAAREVQGRQ